MGISRIFNPVPNAQLGLWEFTESSCELLRMVSLNPEEHGQLANLKKEKRRQEWLACRCLVKAMHPEAVQIIYDERQKPALSDGSYSISMSHSGKYACVYLHQSKAAGVDIQELKESIEKGADFFLHENEQTWVNLKNNLLLHLIWSAKETVFKYEGNPALDLKNSIILNRFDSNQKNAIEVTVLNQGVAAHIQVQFIHLNNYVLTWTV